MGDFPRCVSIHYDPSGISADNARDIDFAIRWGFGWNEGPFETWQAAGWKQITDWVSEDIVAGKALDDTLACMGG